MRTVHWKLFSDATSEQKALKGYERFLQQFGRGDNGEPAVEPCHKGGFTITFKTEVSEADWNAAIVNVLSQAQRVGRQWILSGDITEELDGWSNDPTISGVTAIHVVLEA